jgi:hypothetical protein
MYAALEALEFPSSPPSRSIGRFSTMSCIAVPCFSSLGTAAAAGDARANASRHPNVPVNIRIDNGPHARQMPPRL